MKRILPGAVAVACAIAAAAPVAASAKTYELGSSTVAATTSCPTDCFVVTKTTALEVATAGRNYPTTAPANGSIVAFTLQLGSLSDRQIHFFNSTYGGTSRVAITVLHQTADQRKRRQFTVSAQSETIHIQPFFGTTTTWPLATSLPVKKGDVVALTVQTWAPILAVNLDKTNGWRASRATGCRDLLTQTAQTTVGNMAQYKCLYQTARLTYSATEITTPVPPKQPATTTPRR
jgi:hypothetical protein